MTGKTRRLLIVDDDHMIERGLKNPFSKNGIMVVAEESATGALAQIQAHPNRFPVAIIDHKLPDKAGVDLIRGIREINPAIICFMHSGDDSRDVLKRSIAAGAADFIEKGSDPNDLIEKVLRAFEQQEQRYGHLFFSEESDQLTEFCASEGFIGRSKRLAAVVQDVKDASAHTFSVLILGETGTGKEMAVKAIAKRFKNHLISVNCAALQPTTAESELFGHEKGSFTGADRIKAGLFDAADGGVLFLDEIHMLAPSVQAKLLRVLQTGMVRRHGSNVDRQTNVKVIAASKPDLFERTESGEFLLDLYTRLDVFKIEMPTLAERPEDIELLAKHFLSQYGKQHKRQRFLSQDALQVLVRMPFPGNVRELENLMIKVLFKSPEPVVSDSVLASLGGSAKAQLIPQTIKELEQKFLRERRELIEKTLEKHQGHSRRTAEELGVPTTTLCTWLSSDFEGGRAFKAKLIGSKSKRVVIGRDQKN